MADVEVKQNDFGYYLNFTVQNDDGSVFSIVGYVVTMNVWKKARFPEMLMTGVCAPVVPASGTCRYLVIITDFPTDGEYAMELEMTKAGENISTRTYELTVTESV